MNGSIRFAAFLLVLALLGCGAGEEHSKEASEPKQVQAELATAKRVPIQDLFEATGTVAAAMSATLTAKVMAPVSEVSVREGDTVSDGQTLVRLDLRELSAQVALAGANVNAARAGADAAATAAAYEGKVSPERVSQAEAGVRQAEAMLAAAKARLDLAQEGPRTQERAQADLAVTQAESALRLAEADFRRREQLYAQGAVSKRAFELAQMQYEVAKAQRDAALEAQKIAQEGTRRQDIAQAREGVAQAEAGVAQAKAALSQARTASMQTEIRQKEAASARAGVGQSSAALRAAEVNLSYGSIQAPFAGRIVSRMADPGTLASPGVPLLVIEGGGLMLEAQVPESILPRISVGDKMQVRIDAIGDGEYTAAVAEIVPAANPSARTFTVKLSLPENVGIKSGMFGRANVVLGTEERLTIPEAATWRREGLDYVYVVNAEGLARLRIVTLGRREAGLVEVLSGLKEGESVVLGGQSAASDGAKVNR